MMSDKEMAPVMVMLEHTTDIETEAVKQEQVKHDESLTVLQSVKKYPVATAWCFYMLFICIMWGYDGLAGGIVISLPQFRQDFGYLYEGQYVVSADWQMGLTGAGLIGLILGAIFTGFTGPRLGEKFCIMSAYVLTVAGVFAQWYSPGNLPLLFGGKLITAIPLGVFVTVAPVYAAEVAPPALRGTMVAGVNFSIIVGQIIGYGIMRQVQTMEGSISYRIMFATQWGFAAIGIALTPFLPESPLRLLSRGKEESARKSIAKLYPSDLDADAKVAEMRALLAENTTSGTETNNGLQECFNSANRLRTLVALSIFFFQSSSGVTWIMMYMGYFMQLSGMEGMEVFDTTVGIAGAMAVGSMISWWAVEHIGRRWTTLSGMIACTVCLFVIGTLSQFIDKGRPVVLAQVAFMALWAFMYQASIGSVAYVLVAEIPTSHLRGVVQSMATIVNGLGSSIWVLALPYMINPDQSNMGGNVAWVFFALLLIGSVWGFFFFPETKNRSFEEINTLYARGISPRHFASTQL